VATFSMGLPCLSTWAYHVFPHGYTMCPSGGSGQSYGSVTISGRTSGLPMVWKGSGEPSPNFWCPVRSFGGFWGRCGRVKVVYFTCGLYRGSGQSYGSIPMTGRTPGLPLVCKGREDPSPYFWGPCSAVVLGSLGSSAVGLKQ